MRTPFAVVAALMSSSLLETPQCRHMDTSSDYGMSLAQASMGEGIANVEMKSKKEEFMDEDEDDQDGTGYGHYKSTKEVEHKHSKSHQKKSGHN